MRKRTAMTCRCTRKTLLPLSTHACRCTADGRRLPPWRNFYVIPTPVRERASYLCYRHAAKATGGTGSALSGPAGGSVTRQCHDMAQKKAADCDVVPADCDRQDPAAVRTPQMWPPVDRSSSPSPAHLGKRRQASSCVLTRHTAALMLQRSGRPAATATSSAVAAVDSSPHRTGRGSFYFWRTMAASGLADGA